MLSGDNGILQKATSAKENTERASIIEQAQTDILAQIAENKGGNISKGQLKSILSTYFDDIDNLELPDDLSNSDIKLNANQTYGGYKNIALSDIYNGKLETEEVEVVPQGKVARIGTTYYDTLQNAFDAVPANNTQTEVILLTDISENVLITSNKNIMLDLNSKTIANVDNTIEEEFDGETYEYKESTIKVEESGTLELKNGNITANYGFGIENSGTIIIMSGNISSSITNAVANWGTATINGGTISSSEQILGDECGTINNGNVLTINGGTIKSDYNVAIYNVDGNLEVKGTAQIISNGDEENGFRNLK